MRKRTITMTISKIESELINVTSTVGDERWVPGHTRVTAQGEGERHEWQIRPDQRCWIGDRVTVTVIEDDPGPFETTPLTPPPIDNR